MKISLLMMRLFSISFSQTAKFPRCMSCSLAANSVEQGPRLANVLVLNRRRYMPEKYPMRYFVRGLSVSLYAQTHTLLHE